MVEPLNIRPAPALRPDFDAFLFANVDDVARDVPLRVVSVLARLDLDPWAEAAELTLMFKETAVERLTALLTNLPDSSPTGADSRTIASRLIGLLPTTAGHTSGWSVPDEERGAPVAANFALVFMFSMIVVMIVSAMVHLAEGPTPGPTMATAAKVAAPVPPIPARP
jgi:hypothetical protein